MHTSRHLCSTMLSIILLLLLSFLLNDFAALSFQAYKSLRVPRGHTSSLHSFQASFDEEWPGCNPINKVIPHSNNDERNRDLKSSLTQRLTDKNDLRLGPQSEKFKSGFVSILGNPNVGKSTLMNRILGQNLCIVSPKPQTTRHRIHGILTADPADTTLGKGQASSASVGGKIPLLDEYTRNGYQLVFSDTPGMLTPSYKLQEAMQSTVSLASHCVHSDQDRCVDNNRNIHILAGAGCGR